MLSHVRLIKMRTWPIIAFTFGLTVWLLGTIALDLFASQGLWRLSLGLGVNVLPIAGVLIILSYRPPGIVINFKRLYLAFGAFTVSMGISVYSYVISNSGLLFNLGYAFTIAGIVGLGLSAPQKKLKH